MRACGANIVSRGDTEITKIDIDNYFFQSEFEDEEIEKEKPTKPVEPIKIEVEVDKNKGVKVHYFNNKNSLKNNNVKIREIEYRNNNS